LEHVVELWVALSLVLVLEGLLPALAPGLFRQALVSMATMDERALRVSGLVSMIAGAVILFFIRN
jgi:uncharacterized protein YjeT (DUF2065 family)